MSAIGFGIQGTAPLVTIGVAFKGQPKVTSYTASSAGSRTALSVLDGTKAWVATVGAGQGTLGSYTLKLTSVKTAVTTANGNGYLAHGTLTATLPAMAKSGASGKVTLKASF